MAPWEQEGGPDEGLDVPCDVGQGGYRIALRWLAAVCDAAVAASQVGATGNAERATSVAPALHVSGKRLVNGHGRRVVLHGVDRSGGEFACVQGWGIWDGPLNQATARTPISAR